MPQHPDESITDVAFMGVHTPGRPRDNDSAYDRMSPNDRKSAAFFPSWATAPALSSTRLSLFSTSKDEHIQPHIAREKLLQEMETLLGLESQGTCAWSECEEAREMHEAQYATLRAKLAVYTQTIADTPATSHHPNWAILRDMVDNHLPRFLAHLQVQIDANDAKARHIRAQLDLVRQKRLAVQDHILQFDSPAIPTPTGSASSA